MFKLEINTDNAAFDGDRWGELARILRDFADGLGEERGDRGAVYDVNGNRVGTWRLR